MWRESGIGYSSYWCVARRPDVVYGAAGTVGWYRNTGRAIASAFSYATIIVGLPSGVYFSNALVYVAVADFDADGDPDIVMYGWMGVSSCWLHAVNSRDARPCQLEVLPCVLLQCRALDSSSSSSVTYHVNQRGNFFTSVNIVVGSALSPKQFGSPRGFAVADFNSDGYLDVAMCTFDSKIVLFNNFYGTTRSQGPFPPGLFSYLAAPGSYLADVNAYDFDSDGTMPFLPSPG